MNDIMEAFVNKRGYKYDREHIFWIHDGYSVSLSKIYQGYQLDIGIAFFEGDNRTEGLTARLGQIREMEDVDSVELRPYTVRIRLNSESESLSFVDAVVVRTVFILKDEHIFGMDHCPICKEAFDMDRGRMVRYDHMITKIHDHCYEQLKTGVDRASDSEENGSYLRGAIGALLFGIVSTIPWILLSLVGFIASILGLVIGIGANKGYGLFKGKEGKPKKVILGVVIVMMVIGALFVTTMIDLNNYVIELGYSDVTMTDLASWIFYSLKDSTEMQVGFLKDGALGLLFAFLGARKVFSDSDKALMKGHLQLENVEF